MLVNSFKMSEKWIINITDNLLNKKTEAELSSHASQDELGEIFYVFCGQYSNHKK